MAVEWWRSQALAVRAPTPYYRQVFTPLWWGSRTIGTLPYPEGSISGQVFQRTEAGDVPLANCKVRLYYRPNGSLIGDVATNLQGRYSFDTLMPEEAGYYAVALDPEGAPLQNGALFDSLTPAYLIPILIKYSSSSGTQDVAFTAFTPQTYYARGAVTWEITEGTLPEGMTLDPATGVIRGTPTGAFASPITVTVTDSDKRSASVRFTLQVLGDVLRSDILLGRQGLSPVNTTQTDDGNWQLPDIGFNFELGGVNYRTNIYVASNSFITFGVSSSAYQNLSASNPGRGLLIAAADRSNQSIYAGAVTDGYRIRFEGDQSTSKATPPTLLWEVTLYRDNTMVLVMGATPVNAAGLSMLTDGTSPLATFIPRPGKAYLFQKDGAGNWSVRDYVKSTPFNKQVVALAPVSWFRMNEQSGNGLYDSGTNGRDGTYGASPADASSYSAPSLLADGEGRAITFASNDRSAYTPISVNQSPIDPSKPFSIAVEVRPTAKPVTPGDPVGTIVSLNQPSTGGGVGLDVVGTDANYYFRVMRAGASQVFDTSQTLRKSYGVPTFLVLTSDGSGNVALWADGARVGSGSANYPLYSGMLRIGWADFGNSDRYSMIGDMDELMFFDKVLSESQIRSLAQLAVGDTDPYWSNVVAMLPLTKDFSDKSSRGLTSTATGSPVIDSTDGAVGKGCLQAPPGSFLAVPVNAAVESNDFTVEFFAKVIASRGAQYDGVVAVEAIIGRDYNLFTLTLFRNAFSSMGTLSWDTFDNVSVDYVDDSAWHHWALERKGDQLTLYRDGVLQRRVGVRGRFIQQGPTTTLGKKADYLNGVETRVQYFRFTKGVARYSGADSFSPPTKAFPSRGPS